MEICDIYLCALAEFINLISSESNEVCNREDKRTIAPEHVIKALEVCLTKSHFARIKFFCKHLEIYLKNKNRMH